MLGGVLGLDIRAVRPLLVWVCGAEFTPSFTDLEDDGELDAEERGQ